MDHTKRTGTIVKTEGGVGGRRNSASSPSGLSLSFHNVILLGFLDFEMSLRQGAYKM